MSVDVLGMSLPDLVREGCESVVAESRFVSIDDTALRSFAHTIATPSEGDAWGAWHFDADAAVGGPLTAQYVFVLDALNFCFWPSDSGAQYDALAAGLRAALLADPEALSAATLSRATPTTVAGWVAAPHTLPFLETRAARVRELGRGLAARYGGLAANAVVAARGSVAALATLIAEMCPGFRDEAVYVGKDGAPRLIPFYKRAQILVGDVWVAYGRQTARKPHATGADAASSSLPLGAFYDIDALTAFADYRLPQLLRARGVIVYVPELAEAVDAKDELTHGSPQEVEIRAATVVVVERIKRELGGRVTAVELDHRLWHEGEKLARAGKLAPHHRVRTVFY